MKVEVLSLGVVERDGSPKIHYLPGQYEVDDTVASALRAQGVLAPEAEPPAAEAPADAGDAVGSRKGKGA